MQASEESINMNTVHIQVNFIFKTVSLKYKVLLFIWPNKHYVTDVQSLHCTPLNQHVSLLAIIIIKISFHY